MPELETKSNPDAKSKILSMVKDLDPKSRQEIIEALKREGVLDAGALGAACGPASHNF